MHTYQNIKRFNKIYQGIANGHSADFYYEIKKENKMEINLIFIMVQIGLFTQYRVSVEGFPDTSNIFNGTRINLMVIGEIGPKAKKILNKN